MKKKEEHQAEHVRVGKREEKEKETNFGQERTRGGWPRF